MHKTLRFTQLARLGLGAAALASLAACNPFNETKITGSFDPQSILSTSRFTLEAADHRVALGATTQVRLRIRDARGKPFITIQPKVEFQAIAGTGAGTFGEATNTAPGDYTATFTATRVGTPLAIYATANGTPAPAEPESIQVTGRGIFSPVNSFVTIPTATLESGSTMAATLVAFDTDGFPITTGGFNVTFRLAGGTSTAAFGSVNHTQDGSYSAALTAVGAGSTATVLANVDGQDVTSAAPTLTVTPGPVSLSHSLLTIGGAASSSLASGATTALDITLRDGAGNRVPDATQASHLALALESAGTSSGTLGSIAAVGGNDGAYRATLTATTAGTANGIGAQLDGSALGSTVAFTVSAGSPTHLAFSQQPGGATAGSTLSTAPTVIARDAAGNSVPGFAADVTVAIASGANPGGGTLSGTLTRTPASGTATFAGLSISARGTGYRLSAQSAGLAPATSATFDIAPLSVTHTWPYDAAGASDPATGYSISDASVLQVGANPANGAQSAAYLVGTDQTDDADDAAGFGTGAGCGVAFGTLSSGTRVGLQLADDGTCDGSATNCNALDTNGMPAGLAGYWKLDGGGAIASGSGNVPAQVGGAGSASNANASGMAYVPGKLAQGISFDGVDDHVIVPDSAALRFTAGESITVSAWIEPATLNGYQTVIAKSRTQRDTHANYILRINDDHLEFYYRGANDSWQIWQSGAGAIAAGRWNHVTVSYTFGSGASIAGYVDGKAVSGGWIGGDGSVAPYVQADPLWLGAISDTSPVDEPFNGVLDDVAVWRTALSPAQIAWIHDAQAPRRAGLFVSRVMDAAMSSSWTTLSWKTPLPFFKELSATSESETADTGYADLAHALMSGIVGIWHFNGTWSDASASGLTLAPGGGAGFSNARVLGSASADFAASGAYAQTTAASAALQISGTQPVTVTTWVRSSLTAPGREVNIIGFDNGGNGSSQYDKLLAIGAGTGKFQFRVVDTASHIAQADAPNDGAWHHLAGVFDGAVVRLYVDGSLQAATATAAGTFSFANPHLLFGGANQNEDAFQGQLDEAAIWNRALGAEEVRQLYVRGSSRIRFQIRTCATTDPTCAAAPWQGPDGTIATTFSELNNNASPSDGAGAVRAGLPALSFASFTSPAPLTAIAPAGRYFQYRAVFESDATAGGPELASVAVDPIHYDASSPSIAGNAGLDLSDLVSLTETLGTGGCPAGVTYQLSLDRSTWYYWDAAGSGAWADTLGAGATSSSSAATVTAHATAFAGAVGHGTVYVRAFLNSSGAEPCVLDALVLAGKM